LKARLLHFKNVSWAEGVAQVVERLPKQVRSQNSNFGIAKTKTL
jgi:hypothetical protein